jgi:DNA recombination protein RmuC
VLEKTKKQLDSASNSIDQAGVRTRQIERKLRNVEQAAPEDAKQLLGDALDLPDADGDAENENGAG